MDDELGPELLLGGVDPAIGLQDVPLDLRRVCPQEECRRGEVEGVPGVAEHADRLGHDVIESAGRTSKE